MTPQSPARGVHAPRNFIRRSATFLVAAVLFGGVPLVAEALTEETGPAVAPSRSHRPPHRCSRSRPHGRPRRSRISARTSTLHRNRSMSPRRPHRSSRTCPRPRPRRYPTSRRLARRRASGPPCVSANRAATTRSRVGPGSTAAPTSSIVRRGTRSPSATRRRSSASTRRRPHPPIRTPWPWPFTPSAAPARGHTAAVTWADATPTRHTNTSHQHGDPSVMMA